MQSLHERPLWLCAVGVKPVRQCTEMGSNGDRRDWGQILIINFKLWNGTWVPKQLKFILPLKKRLSYRLNLWSLLYLKSWDPAEYILISFSYAKTIDPYTCTWSTLFWSVFSPTCHCLIQDGFYSIYRCLILFICDSNII